VCAGDGPFAATGEMVPSGAAGSPVLRCGDPATAVGVIPYDTAGTSFCPLGTGLEEFDVTMRTEDNPRCSASSGSAGESAWLLPDDDSTRSHQCGNAPLTRLSFCRVDGALFKPVTGDSDANQYYAVLQLGTSCPNGSASVTKHIDTEDAPDPPDANGVTGFPGENAVASGDRTKTYVELHFCYFRADADPTRRMGGFPDLGIPYAVFHRFADQQPSWVIAKAWRYTQDETDAVNSNGYPGLTPDLNDFKSVIENTQNSTFYDLARVR
jgi:hypothetical protein